MLYEFTTAVCYEIHTNADTLCGQMYKSLNVKARNTLSNH